MHNMHVRRRCTRSSRAGRQSGADRNEPTGRGVARIAGPPPSLARWQPPCPTQPSAHGPGTPAPGPSGGRQLAAAPTGVFLGRALQRFETGMRPKISLAMAAPSLQGTTASRWAPHMQRAAGQTCDVWRGGWQVPCDPTCKSSEKWWKHGKRGQLYHLRRWTAAKQG